MLNKGAFLFDKIIDCSAYNLMLVKANIFLKEVFVGTFYINLKQLLIGY